MGMMRGLGSTISVGVLVDELNGFIDGINTEAQQNRAKNFLLVTGHIRFHISEDSGANKVALGELWHLHGAGPLSISLNIDCTGVGLQPYSDATAIKNGFRSLVNAALDKAQHSVLPFFGDQGTQISTRGEAGAHFELLGTFSQFRDP